MMDTEQVIKFLKSITDQLGPAGEQAFRIVMSRVLGEAVIWTAFGTAIFILGTLVMLSSLAWYRKHSSERDSENTPVVGIGFWIICFIISLGTVVPSVVNLLSPEYATIERILHLVSSK